MRHGQSDARCLGNSCPYSTPSVANSDKDSDRTQTQKPTGVAKKQTVPFSLTFFSLITSSNLYRRPINLWPFLFVQVAASATCPAPVGQSALDSGSPGERSAADDLTLWPLLHQGPIDGHEGSGVPRSHACMRSWAPRAKTTIRTQATESVIGQPKSQNGHAGLVSVVAQLTVLAVGTHSAPTTGGWTG